MALSVESPASVSVDFIFLGLGERFSRITHCPPVQMQRMTIMGQPRKACLRVVALWGY